MSLCKQANSNDPHNEAVRQPYVYHRSDVLGTSQLPGSQGSEYSRVDGRFHKLLLGPDGCSKEVDGARQKHGEGIHRQDLMRAA